MKTRTQRSVWNVVTGALLMGLPLIAAFISTPWILKWLGADRFGAFRVLVDGFGYITLLDLGLIGSVTARLGPKIAENDEQAVFGILVAGFRVYMWIGAATLLAGSLLILSLPNFMHLRAIGENELRVAAWILLLPIMWVPFSVFRALTEARQRGYLVNLLLTAQLLLTTSLLMLTAWAGWGLIGQAIAVTAAAAPLTIVLVLLGIRRYRGVLTAKPDRQFLQEVRSLNGPTFWFNISGRLGLLSDNIVISCILGPAAAVPFFLTQRLAQIAQLQLQSIGNATWAGLVELYSQDHTAQFCARLMELTGVVSALGIAVLGPIAAYNRHFITLWIGSASYASEWVNAIACINIWILAIVSLWCWPISGMGQIAAWLPYALLFSAINIVVSVVATYLIGPAGPLTGTFIAFVSVHCWALPRVLGRLFHRSLRGLWKPAAAPLLWGVPYSLLLWFVARIHTPPGWLGLAAEAGTAVLGGLLLWWLSLGSDMRQQWQYRFRSALAL